MKKMTLTAAALILSMVTALAMTGCSALIAEDTSNTEQRITAQDDNTDPDEHTEDENESNPDSVVNASPVSFSAAEGGKINAEELFSKRDLAQTADLSGAIALTAADGQKLTVSEEGVYVLSGTAKECTVTVDADDSAKVQLVLDGLNITNSSTPAIYVKSADKVFITTAEGSSNTLSTTGQFTADGDTDTDAVIFSKDDLVLNGTGTLHITSAYGNGISGKDDLKITGGTYTVEAAQDAVEANDSIAVCGGSMTITAGKDGFHSENDNAEGYVLIADGTLEITAKSDGIQATDILQIDGGTVTASGSEGLEATYVQINGGKITVNATDDGINASQKCSSLSPVIEINGGELYVTVGQGDTDALDANGSIIVNGGYINVTAPTSSFDYDTNAEFNGGTIIINGEEVDEIPEDMMGRFGGMGGGFGGRGGRGGRGNGDFSGFGDGENEFPGFGDGENEFPGFGDGENGFPGFGDGENGFSGFGDGENGFSGRGGRGSKGSFDIGSMMGEGQDM